MLHSKEDGILFPLEVYLVLKYSRNDFLSLVFTFDSYHKSIETDKSNLFERRAYLSFKHDENMFEMVLLVTVSHKAIQYI